MSALIQTEFPLRVPVCAWCEPADLGMGIVVVSHGICPRHFRQLKLESQKIARRQPLRSHHRSAVKNRS